MDLTQITPLILTYNEGPNIGRCLANLSWAQRVVVIDSGSNDETLEILSQHSNVEVFGRKFDSFAKQCNFGLAQINSEWSLSIDADYLLSDELMKEIRSVKSASQTNGYSVGFKYCIFGKPLVATLYPPRVVLYRAKQATYHDEGHGHRVTIEGKVASLSAVVLHDDRKSLSRWFRSQIGYSQLEAAMLDEATHEARLTSYGDKLRRWYLAPLVVPFYCLLVKGLLLSGWAGIYYTFQRTVAELMIATALLDRRLRTDTLKKNTVSSETHTARSTPHCDNQSHEDLDVRSGQRSTTSESTERTKGENSE